MESAVIADNMELGGAIFLIFFFKQTGGIMWSQLL